jgi:hypothetical protein
VIREQAPSTMSIGVANIIYSIPIRRIQLSFGDGPIAEEVSNLRESWMIHADAVLADDLPLRV